MNSVKSKDEKTSRKVASIASQILRDKSSSMAMKSVAASALTQTPDRRRPELKKQKQVQGREDEA